MNDVTSRVSAFVKEKGFRIKAIAEKKACLRTYFTIHFLESENSGQMNISLFVTFSGKIQTTSTKRHKVGCSMKKAEPLAITLL